MMDALINVVVPVFGVVFTGYLAGRSWGTGAGSQRLPSTASSSHFALPPALFIFMARAPVEQIFNWPFIGAFVGGALADAVSLGWSLDDFGYATTWRRSALLASPPLQANAVYMGLPLLLTAYGPGRCVADDSCHPLPHSAVH